MYKLAKIFEINEKKLPKNEKKSEFIISDYVTKLKSEKYKEEIPQYQIFDICSLLQIYLHDARKNSLEQ